MPRLSMPAGRFGGVEMGGTKTVVTLADGREIADRRSIATTDPDETLGRAVEMLLGWHTLAPLDAIGVASFGPVRVNPGAADHGRILDTPKPGWRGTDVLAPFAAAFDCPLALDTDVNAAGIAEARMGAGRDCRLIVYLTIGTGVGGGVIVDGRPAVGRLHPEIGHLRLRRAAGDRFGGTCAFHADCIEGLVSGPALAARLGGDPRTVPHDDRGWAMAAHDLAELLGAIMLMLSPERIVVGGGVGLGQPRLLAAAIDQAAAQLAAYLPDYGRSPLSRIVVPAGLRENAGPIGAILLASDNASGLPRIPG